MNTKKKAYLFAMSLAILIALLNVAPQVAYNSEDYGSAPAAYTAPSLHNQFRLLITPTPTGASPEADDDSYVTDEDSLLIVSAPGVLANDYDVDGDILVAMVDTFSSHGSLELFSDGSFIYDPEPDFFGVDFFTYRANDGESDSNIATVTITVNPVNDPPVAVDDLYETDEDTTLIAYPGVLANDFDVDLYDFVTARLVTLPEHGSLVFFLEGDFEYTPDPDWNGIDYFQYQAFDTYTYGNIATVTIIVHPVNDAPVAVDDEFVMDEDTILTIYASDLLANDYDVDGDDLLISIESYPSFGTLEILYSQMLVITPDQIFVYTPNPDWYGVDSFTYRLFDGTEYSEIATVTITVLDVIDDITPPVTTISFDGVLDDRGWYISRVLVTLTATDDYAVLETMYSFDEVVWFTYIEPFNITTDGVTAIWYYSIDTVGNKEETKSDRIVIDTDITGPVITIIYTGDGTDGSSGYWTVIVVDPESGVASILVEVDGVLVGLVPEDYAVPNSLGLHTIRVDATNADLTMGIEDQEFSTLSMTVTIVDDDTTGPEISIIYFGGATVTDPGYWTVTVVDPESGIASIIVEIDGTIVGMAAGEYAVPSSEGTHTITVTAYNGDLDRGELDQEASIASASVTIKAGFKPGFVTGGGWIVDGNGNKAHFAFVVHLKPNGDIVGMFLYTFKESKRTYMVVGTEFLGLVIDGNHAYFEAQCSIMRVRDHSCKALCIEDGYTIRVDVWENHGKRNKDIFQIRIYDSSGQTFYEAGFDPIGYVHGAIVIHEFKRHRCCHCHHGRW